MQCSYNRRDISGDAHRTGRLIAYTVFVHGHIQGVGVTAYRMSTYYIVKLERWGQMLRIIGNSWQKKTAETIAMMSVKYTYIVRKHCFLAVISKHEVSK